MEASLPQQYRVSDFIEWNDKRQLELNPYFQRRNIWTAPAKHYLIDTILRQMPMPKVFIRTKVDLSTQKSFREVVDGQQRLRAIFDFASDRLVLGRRSGAFAGATYSTLDPEHKEVFLSYSIAVDQLINATDSDVLEVFARLNSYTLSLTPPELRHAKYQGNFKWAVHAASKRWDVLWTGLRIVTLRERLRMQDDSLMAELFGVTFQGVTDGGQKRITDLYKAVDATFPDNSQVAADVDATLAFIVEHFADVLVDSPLAGPPHFVMIFAAVTHALAGIQPGGLGDELPERDPRALANPEAAAENLAFLGDLLRLDEPPSGWQPFWRASKSTTQRISSRRARFPVYWRALFPEVLA